MSTEDPLPCFEKTILRPLWVVLIALGITSAIQTHWWLTIVCFACLIYLGTIGSKLHPLMTASELSEGPLESEASKLEQEVIQLATRRFLVSQACTRAGLVVGAGIGCSIAAFLDTHWYWALLGGISASVAVGVILKLFFRVVPQSDHEGI